MYDGRIELEFAVKGQRGMDNFQFSLGDVVLAEWEDKLFYAKIQKIDRVSGQCSLIFDDDSVEECPFSKIHSVTETTAEIVCIICKDGTSVRPNEIVLCDKCGIGYHQNCHDPGIPAEALEFDAPWMCVYCSIGAFCPYLENPFESKTTRKGVRKTRIHTLKSGETLVSSGNSTDDERELQRERLKRVVAAGSLSSHDMSSFYFSSHSHQREGGKPRGRPPFSHKSKASGDNKRGRTTGRPPARLGIRERDPERNANDFDAIQQRKLSSHHFQRQSGEGPRHQARYGPPVRNTRLVEESTEGRKLSPASEPTSKRLQHVDEPPNKVTRVIAHRRDAPREKQRLTQDLARQKRLLSEDIARAELLQREQLTKKLVDIFENRKENPSCERVEDMEDNRIPNENINVQRSLEESNCQGASMYDRCYGDHSPEYKSELVNERSIHTRERNNDKVSKLAPERESLFDRFLWKGGAQEKKNIEFVNESKVEVRQVNYSKDTRHGSKQNASPLSDMVVTSSESEFASSTDAKRKSDLDPLTFENVSDDELMFSDRDGETVTQNSRTCASGLQENGESPVFPAENGLESEPEVRCNGVKDDYEFMESVKNESGFPTRNLFNNLAEYEPCECPSEDGQVNCENNVTKGNALVVFDNTECTQASYLGVDDQSDHSSIKISKLARLMEEPDMQCEHSSKYENVCVTKYNEGSSLGVAEGVNAGQSHERIDNGVRGSDDSGENHVVDSHSEVLRRSDKAAKGDKYRHEPDDIRNAECHDFEGSPEKKEIQTSRQHSKETADNNEQNPENVPTESELSNIEGMSDAGELSEPEQVALPVRGKVKKKKRKKPKGNKIIHKTVVNSPRRKTKGSKGRASGKLAKSTKRIKQLDSESDDAMLKDKNKSGQLTTSTGAGVVANLNECENNGNVMGRESNSPLSGLNDKEETTPEGQVKQDSELNFTKESGASEKECEKKQEHCNSQTGNEECFANEDVAVVTASDSCDSGQEGCSLPEAQEGLVKEDKKRDETKKEKRLGVRQKRKSEEKDKEKERSTPPHLISQNRYARDLPRHNWLVELLLQQNKLCAEDTLQQARASKGDQSKDEAQLEKEDDPSLPQENQENVTSQGKQVEQSEVPSSPLDLSNQEELPASSPRDNFQSELHRSFLRRSFPPNVPKTLPRLKPSSPDSSSGSESVLKSAESRAPPPPPLKHGLPSKESSDLESVPKIRKLVDEPECKSSLQDDESVNAEADTLNKEPALSDGEHARKLITPIEILDDEDEKRKLVQEELPDPLEPSNTSDETPKDCRSDDSNRKDTEQPFSKSQSLSPPRKPTTFLNAKKPFSAVNPTIPGGIKDNLGRPMHMPQHRAAILIPVVPMHDGSGIAVPPGLGPPSPHMKGYSPRTFTPHLITHSAPVPGSGIFGSPLSQASRFSANPCGHHLHGNMKSGVPCKRDVNCPFHGNNPRGLPSGILSISHHGPMHAFGHHAHDHVSGTMSRERRESEKAVCPQPDCRTCQSEKLSPPERDRMGDKSPIQGPKVVKPIAHVANKRPPLMLSHLQQMGKPSLATLRELEALREDKARRFGGDVLLSPHQLQKVAEKSSREHIVPAMSPHHERRPLHQPLTLSDLNRRREEEMIRAKAEESLKSKPLPGDLIIPGLNMPSPSRGLSKHSNIPYSKESNRMSPGRSPGGTLLSPSEKRDAELLNGRHGDEITREHGAFMTDFLKPPPPRLRPLDDADIRFPSERQRHEEHILNERENSPFYRLQVKDNAVHSVKSIEEKNVSSQRAVDLLGRGGRPGRETDGPPIRSLVTHGNSGVMNIGLRQLEEQRKQSDEPSNREEHKVRERVSPDVNSRIRLKQPSNHQERRRSLELLQVKDKDPRMELQEKESLRIPVPEREHVNEPPLLRHGEGSRLPYEPSSPVRLKLYHERPFIGTGLSTRMEARLGPRMVALHELEMHRREAVRASEPSHRELLSRMASSLPINKVGPHGKSFFARPESSVERRGTSSSRISSEIRGWSPPTSLASREYGMVLNSRQAMERLAAAAGKPGTLLGEVGKDIPPHIRQDIERERERERQRLSLEQIEANRRLLHAELKDKVNPLVFSKEHQLRNEQKREQIEVLRAREKLLADRERFLVMERIAEERKRKFSDRDSPHGGMLLRHPSSPPFARIADREEYERIKRLKLGDVAISVKFPTELGKIPSEGKDGIRGLRNHGLTAAQIREKGIEASEVRLHGSRELELLKSRDAERESGWFGNVGMSLRTQEELDRKRAGMHAVPPIFLPPKGGSFLPPREKNSTSGKSNDGGVNRCSVCRRDASFLCSGCQAAWYCSSECQLSAWGSHSSECGQNRRHDQRP